MLSGLRPEMSENREFSGFWRFLSVSFKNLGIQEGNRTRFHDISDKNEHLVWLTHTFFDHFARHTDARFRGWFQNKGTHTLIQGTPETKIQNVFYSIPLDGRSKIGAIDHDSGLFSGFLYGNVPLFGHFPGFHGF